MADRLHLLGLQRHVLFLNARCYMEMLKFIICIMGGQEKHSVAVMPLR